MRDNCQDCGRPITDSHMAFTEQWEPGRAEVCYPHVNFGGQQLCAERAAERLQAQLTQAQAEIAALRRLMAAADPLREMVDDTPEHMTSDWARIEAYDQARAEVPVEKSE